ncbi:Alpha/Beta hydrolase protein [Gautieria morchelliformis]|nr:Alpha/Beta hydrolase protein [Gautieria morchelliformis]
MIMMMTVPIYRHGLLTIIMTALHVVAQSVSLPPSFPHLYPGIPNTQGDFSDSRAWQKYFEVTDALPNVTFPLTRSYAGNLPVNRPNHPNNTLFFWAFEKDSGSLTNQEECGDDPWVIWLNGGPGASSLLGLTLENGPIHFAPDFSAIPNAFSWDKAADVLWVDQPVGTGWSTSDADAFVTDEDQVGVDFMGFLSNLVQVFPALATRPLYLTGESYAGTYFSTPHPPVKVAKIAMGDGSYAADETVIYPAVPSVLETYPQLIGYDPDVLKYFQEQTHLCGFDLNLTYPQNGILPTVVPPVSDIVGASSQRGSGSMSRTQRNMLLKRTLRHVERAEQVRKREVGRRTKRSAQAQRHREVLKRDLTLRPNGTIDPFYGCDTFDEMVDYALNFSAPWAGNDLNGFDFIPDALDPEALPTPDSVGVFLNDPRVVSAIHAPTSKNWTWVFTLEHGYPFGGGFNDGIPMNFFSQLASNLSSHDIPWVFMSGNADGLLPHFGTEVVIQNTTFGGIQGFTQRPSTPFYDSQGNFAGKVHQERNLTFALFAEAGHTIPAERPDASLTFFKEFILGCNPLGTVLPDGTTIGGTNATLAQSILPAYRDPIFFGSGTIAGSTVAPAATVAAWEAFVATADLSGVSAPTPTGIAAGKNP